MSVDAAILVLRILIGLLFVGHGAQKLFGTLGGPGLSGFAGWLESLGIRPSRVWAPVAGLSELVGGVLLALGLLNPLGPLGIMASMLVAIVKVHWSKGLWVTNQGIEYPLVLFVVCGVLGLLGPGRLSLDASVRVALPMPETFWVGLALVVAGVAVAASGNRLRAGFVRRERAV
jgi:putative oxidoreductase